MFGKVLGSIAKVFTGSSTPAPTKALTKAIPTTSGAPIPVLKKDEEEERKRRARIAAESSDRKSFIQNAAEGGGFISPTKLMGR
jgi:hypothetical protein